MDKPNYELSRAQRLFCLKAHKQGYEVDYSYSGRGMFGQRCPAVRHDAGYFSYSGACVDQMGRGLVTYMPR